jgi:hypothetical protein
MLKDWIMSLGSVWPKGSREDSMAADGGPSAEEAVFFWHQEKLKIPAEQYFREPWGRDGNEYERFILQEKVRRSPLLNSIVRTASNYSLFVGFAPC